MKKVLVLIMTLGFSYSAHAVVVDNLECNLQFWDHSGRYSASSQPVSVVRHSLSQSPAPDVRLTAGSSYINLVYGISDTESLHVDGSVFYQHAVKLNARGQETDPRQTTCVAINATYCKRAPNDPPCAGSGTACGFNGDPYDPVFGWTPVSMRDGVPTFYDMPMVARMNIVAEDGTTFLGKANLFCSYQGTMK